MLDRADWQMVSGFTKHPTVFSAGSKGPVDFSSTAVRTQISGSFNINSIGSKNFYFSLNKRMENIQTKVLQKYLS